MAMPSTLGRRLAQARREKAAREHRDIQQADLAAAAGASKASVSRWENDHDRPREAALAKLAKYLGVTPAYLRYGLEASAGRRTSHRQTKKGRVR